jgi:hypothetical protein
MGLEEAVRRAIEEMVTREAERIVEDIEREFEENPESAERIGKALMAAHKALLEAARVYAEEGGYVVPEDLAATLAWVGLAAFDSLIKVAAQLVRSGSKEDEAFATAVMYNFAPPLIEKVLVGLRATRLMAEREG